MDITKIIEISTEISSMENDLERINALIAHRQHGNKLNPKIPNPFNIITDISVMDTCEYEGFASLSPVSCEAISKFYLSYEKIAKVLEDQIGFLKVQLRNLVNDRPQYEIDLIPECTGTHGR